ncbi:hypothetical protein GUITHDRAFT_147517 [Guillardia theta CCMP2712]|uniref:Uncharacterized protein n=1 Tax=Guillardia theta (strain CCMP2712) TaxID=905079 RepID=L1ID30_GUITC|nr:hypothetical protein GUITHDRAFT_147517 [Guillardia theta CCMP2712]EKX34002.1 hypothetical protein GUITHDRAFT_147517 [Guillardia theta CCMP2712]|eukprot:XP_005820982.1 hypothetical protein GUITHDRAFT_147517 [Guillardia theta CCMP2712]
MASQDSGSKPAESVRRLTSVRGTPDLDVSGSAPSRKPKFAPKIPVRAPVIKTEPQDTPAAAKQSRDAQTDKGGWGRGGEGEGGSEEMQRTGLSMPPTSSELTIMQGKREREGTRISYSNNSSASKEGSWGPDVDADVDGQEINETHMPTTLPFTPRRPWDPREIKVSDEDMSDVTMLKKLVMLMPALCRHVLKAYRPSRYLARKQRRFLEMKVSVYLLTSFVILSVYSILLRRDKWDNESIGLTKEHVQQHSESMMEQLDADDQPHNIWAVAKEAVNVDAPNHHCFAAGSILSPTRQDGSKAEDRLLLLQLPHTFPFVKDSMEGTGGLEHGDAKLIVLRVTLRLGEVNYKIAEAAQSNFLQQVVATKDSSDDMFHLGDIFAKLNVIPDLESLLGNDV